MSKYSESKTPAWQRVFIWIVAIVMTGGTIAGMIFAVIATQNQDLNPEKIASDKEQKAQEEKRKTPEYKEQVESWKKDVAEQLKTLLGIDGYEQYVGAFDAASVTELKVEALSEGTGATVAENATVTALYTGWTPDGRIFDSTKIINEDMIPREFSLNQVIEGWSRGLVGMRAGGVYLLTIPASLAYGEEGSRQYYIDYDAYSYDYDNYFESIPPNTPLRFLVQIVDVVNN